MRTHLSAFVPMWRYIFFAINVVMESPPSKSTNRPKRFGARDDPHQIKKSTSARILCFACFQVPATRDQKKCIKTSEVSISCLSHFNISFSSGPPTRHESTKVQKATNHFRTTMMGIRLKTDALIGIGRLRPMVRSKNWPENIGCLPTAERWQNNASYACFFKQGGTEGVLTSCSRESVGTSKSFSTWYPCFRAEPQDVNERNAVQYPCQTEFPSGSHLSWDFSVVRVIFSWAPFPIERQTHATQFDQFSGTTRAR